MKVSSTTVVVPQKSKMLLNIATSTSRMDKENRNAARISTEPATCIK